MPSIGTFHSTNLLLRFNSSWGLRIFSLSHTCDKMKKTSFSNLFLFSHHHIPTNSIAPLSEYKHTHNPQILRSLWRRANTQRSALKLFTVANYVINSVDNTKLPCYTLPLMQHQSFFRNLPLCYDEFGVWINTMVAKTLQKLTHKIPNHWPQDTHSKLNHKFRIHTI